MYLKLRAAGNPKSVKSFVGYYEGIKTDNEEDREQIERDARADAPEWGVSGVSVSWVEEMS